MKILELIYIAFFAAWFFLTVLNQFGFEWFWKHVSSRDIFRIIPGWTFFAPHPGIYDHFLLGRYRHASSGHWSEWQVIEDYTGRKLWHIFINPDKRLYKIYIDIVTSITRDYKNEVDYPDIMQLQIPYIALANCASYKMRTCRQIDADDFIYQFSLVRSHGVNSLDRQKQIFFVSGEHRSC